VSEIAYRLARVSDIETLVALRLAFLAEGGYGGPDAPWLSGALREYFTTMLRNGYFVGAIAEVAGAVVGTSGMVYDRHPPRLSNPSGVAPYIMNMYVVPEYRRRGIATSLLQTLITEARAANCRVVTLHFWPGKSALYTKLGFVPVETEMKLEL